METHPVLDVELAELAVSLHAAGGAGHLLHEGAQLHGLSDQGPTHSPEVGVSLGGQRKVMSAKVFINSRQLKLSRQDAFLAIMKKRISYFEKSKDPSIKTFQIGLLSV